MAGGFQSTRKAGDFPSTGRTATHGGAGTGEVDTVNGVNPDAKGNVQLTASDVGSYGKGESEQKFEPKRATGLIDQTVDPTTKPEGDYYVTEKFIGAPTIASGSYVGVMRINLDFDGSDNGGLIEYYADGVMYYKVKFTGGWSGWTGGAAAGARTLTRLSNDEQTIQTLQNEVQQNKDNIKALQGASPPTPKFDPSMFQSAVDHGYAKDDQGIKSTKTTDGWWIFKDLKSVGGRPIDSKGDLYVFKNTVEKSPANKHAIVMAIGASTSSTNKVWFMYRDGTQWTPWFEQQGASQAAIDAINTEISALKAGNASAVARITALETKVGDVYAPDKSTFDTAVNALINAALKNYTPKSGGHGGDKPALTYPRFYAQFINSVPTDFTGATTSTNSEATLIRIPTTQSRIFISIENDNDEASKVKGFKFNNKMEMKLSHRDIVVQGKKYRAFYTSGAFSESKIDIKVDFGQGI